MLLYRPVGPEELRLMFESGMKAYPPRLADQPIFYPVTNEAYARQIAGDWNTKTGSFSGFVSRFVIDDSYAARFERKVVGAASHEELWVPAEELPILNSHIDGRIVLTSAHFGASFSVDAALATWDWAWTGRSDLAAMVARDPFRVFLSYFYWQQSELPGLERAARDTFLAEVDVAWSALSPAFPLGVQA